MALVEKYYNEYGYRRAVSELCEAYGEKVNHKVVQKLHQTLNLKMVKGVKKPKPSGIIKTIKEAGSETNLLKKLLKARKPEILEVLVTDFSEIIFAQGTKKAQFMPLVDYSGKLVPGWAIGPRDNTDLALKAWGKAKETITSWGRKIEGIIVHHDQDPVYTSYDWGHQLLVIDKARLSYTESGSKDNTIIESFLADSKLRMNLCFLMPKPLKNLGRLLKNGFCITIPKEDQKKALRLRQYCTDNVP